MTAFFSILLVAGLVFYFLRRIKSKSDYPLRKIAALEAIDEVVGRATELGRPVFFSGGQGDVVGNEGTQVLAGLDVLGYVAKKSAEYNTQLVAAVCKENVHAITEGTVKAAYTEAGHPEMYQPEMVRFLSPTQMAYTAASISIIQREKVAASILSGCPRRSYRHRGYREAQPAPSIRCRLGLCAHRRGDVRRERLSIR